MSGGYGNFRIFSNDDSDRPKQFAKRTGSFEAPGYLLATGQKVLGDKPSKQLLKVKDILDMRIKNGVEQYLIKWVRWEEDKYDTWEPLKNLKCPLLLERFRDARLMTNTNFGEIDKEKVYTQRETVRNVWLKKFGDLFAADSKPDQSKPTTNNINKEQENDQPVSKLLKIETNEISEIEQEKRKDEINQPKIELESKTNDYKPDKSLVKKRKVKPRVRPPCEVCGIDFSNFTRQQIYVHKLKHKSLRCSICSKKYATTRNLELHVRVSHPSV